MFKFVRFTSLAILVSAIAGCATFGSAVTGTSTVPSASFGFSAVASAQPALPAQSNSMLDVLAVPPGATPWKANTDAPMSLTSYIQTFYVKSAWNSEMGLYKQRKFKSGVIEGWINADGTQQEIAIARFSNQAGAISLFDGLTNTLKNMPAPAKEITDATDGGVGTVSPTLDNLGNAIAEIAGHVGDYVIDVHEFSAASPDPAAAEALLAKQYQALKGLPVGSASRMRPVSLHATGTGTVIDGRVAGPGS